MKTTDTNKLKDKLGRTNPFDVPEGYFETFTRQLMKNLPEQESTDEQSLHIGTWQRIRPWFYLAAMFGGIMFGMRYMLSGANQQPENTSPMATIETTIDNNSYYDEYLEDMVVHSRMDDYTVYCCLNNSEENS